MKSLVCAVMLILAVSGLGAAAVAAEIPVIAEIAVPQLHLAGGLAGWALAGGVNLRTEGVRQVLALEPGGTARLAVSLSRGNQPMAGRRYVLRFWGQAVGPGAKARAAFAGRSVAVASADWQEYEIIADTKPFLPGNPAQDAEIVFTCEQVGGSGQGGGLRIREPRLLHLPVYGLQLRYTVAGGGKGKFAGEVYIIRRHRDKSSKDPLRQRYHASLPLAAVTPGRASGWIDLSRHLFGDGEATLCLKLWRQGGRPGSGQVKAKIEFASHLAAAEAANENAAGTEAGMTGSEDLVLDDPAVPGKAADLAHVILAGDFASANGFFTFMVPESEKQPKQFVSTLRAVADDAQTRLRHSAGKTPPGSTSQIHIPVGANVSDLELILDPDSIRREYEIMSGIGITSTARDGNAPVAFDRSREQRFPGQSFRDRSYAGRISYQEFANPELSPYNGELLAAHMNRKYAALAAQLGSQPGQPSHIEILDLFDEPPNLGIVRQDLDEFRRFLREDARLTPADFGAADWAAVLPEGGERLEAAGPAAPAQPVPGLPEMGADAPVALDDEAAPDLAGPPLENMRDAAGLSLEARRLRYYTRLFCARKTADYFRAATAAVEKHLPGMKTAVNFRAGIRRVLTPETADWFRIGRDRAVTMMWNEDWLNTYGWRHNGVQLVSYYVELMRAAARKRQLPLGGFLMCYWGEAELKSYAALAHGSRYLHYWRYGPAYANYLPYSWSHNQRVVGAVSQVCRDLQRLGGALVTAERDKPRTALLYAKADPLWGRAQDDNRLVFLALLHDQIPVDIITEEEIEADGILDGYAALYVTDEAVRAGTQEMIAAWVEAGGALWLSGGAAAHDEFDSPCALLYGRLGVSVAAAGAETAEIAAPDAAGQPVRKYRVTATGSGDAVLKFADGALAMLKGRCGKGSYAVCGFRAGEFYEANVRPHYNRENGKGQIQKGWSGVRRAWITGLALDNPRCRGPVALDRPCVEAVMYRHPEQDLLFLVNFSGEYPEAPLTATVASAVEIRAVESLRRGPLTFTKSPNGISFSLPLDRTDIILIKK